MLTLIKKEYMLCRTSLFIGLLFFILTAPITMLFMSIMTEESPVGIISFVLSLVLAFFLTTAVSLDKEKKAKGYRIYYSLPIERDLIVRAKYLSAAIFTLAQALINMLLSYIFKWTKGFKFLGTVEYGVEIKAISIFTMILSLGIFFFFLSIYLYVFFSKLEEDKKEKKGPSIVLYLYFALIIFGRYILPEKFIKTLWEISKIELGGKFLIIGIFIFSLFIYCFSMHLSQKQQDSS